MYHNDPEMDFPAIKRNYKDILIIQENRYQIGFHPFGSGFSI
ncbi:hypothetical protein PORCRE_805 [Porphyromonas crevioricanis JCM 15906]|uniref:Uncharacterized protein n=1 Tax=Porphyromonas crevioricanis JCM 15906 TaxID=1305617 RepID=T1CMV3_9PORP|nr:hypothetical protein PORCRE_805 [Porphyromonas crevioricanis JCM 15906]SJZ69663.1 hypothetical protein SAMN02745203_00611 [Porphyromonas crevioricanis]